MIVGMRKIVSIDHDSDAEEDVSGTSGDDDDDDSDEVDVVEHADDMVVPNRETQLVEIDLEEEEEVDDVGVVENVKKGML